MSELFRKGGNAYVSGLVRAKSLGVLVKNADGIDLRVGCHHITVGNLTVENISGGEGTPLYHDWES